MHSVIHYVFRNGHSCLLANAAEVVLREQSEQNHKKLLHRLERRISPGEKETQFGLYLRFHQYSLDLPACGNSDISFGSLKFLELLRL